MLLWQAARDLAQEVLSRTPVRDHGLDDLVSIAHRYGAIVYIRPMKRDVSGMILKNEGEDPEIFVNATESMERQRFTLAHEIGHLVERIDVAGDRDFSFVDYRKADNYNLHEFFADEFAGELLMPAEEFQQVYRDQGDYGASVHFGVSVPAVRKRAQRLEKNPPVMVE